jgi:hypothetical protein
MSAEKLYKVFSRDNILVITDEINPQILITDASGDLEKKLGSKATGEGGYIYYISASEVEEFEEYMKRNAK